MNSNSEIMQFFRKFNDCPNCKFQKSTLCFKTSTHYLRATLCLENIALYPTSFYWQIPCHYCYFTPRSHILLQNTVSSSICKNNLCCGIYILKFLPFEIREIWAPTVLRNLRLWLCVCVCMCVCWRVGVRAMEQLGMGEFSWHMSWWKWSIKFLGILRHLSTAFELLLGSTINFQWRNDFFFNF